MSVFSTTTEDKSTSSNKKPVGRILLKLEDITFECPVWRESTSESDSRNAFNDLALTDKEKLIKILKKHLKDMEVEVVGLKEHHKGKSIFG